MSARFSGSLVAISADLIGSRRQRGRRELADRVESALATINRRYADSLIADLETTRGLDEISGLLRLVGPVLDLALELNLRTAPASFRFGIGIGTIDVWGESGRAADLDGPAFHGAAESLREVHESYPTLAVDAPQWDTVVRAHLNASATACLAMQQAWPTRVREVQLLRLDSPEIYPNQQAIAEHLGVTQQAVSKASRRALVPQFEALRSATRKLLESRQRGDVDGC